MAKSMLGMAGTTGLEPATSCVTVTRSRIPTGLKEDVETLARQQFARQTLPFPRIQSLLSAELRSARLSHKPRHNRKELPREEKQT